MTLVLIYRVRAAEIYRNISELLGNRVFSISLRLELVARSSCCSPWQVTCCQVIIPTCPSQGTRSPFSLSLSSSSSLAWLWPSLPSRLLHWSSWSIVLLCLDMDYDALPVFADRWLLKALLAMMMVVVVCSLCFPCIVLVACHDALTSFASL